MSTVDYSERDADGKIIGPPKIAIIGGGARLMMEAGLILAGAGIPCITEPQRIHPPVVYSDHERHQGAKERERRLKRRRTCPA